MEQEKLQSSRGILNAETGKQKFTLQRFRPDEDVAYFVQHYWIVKWDLRGQPPYHQRVIAHPNVNLVFEKGYTGVYGVHLSTTSHRLEEKGWVFGVKFRPGGFYPFWKKDVSGLTGSVVGFREVFGFDSKPLEKDIFGQEDIQQAIRVVNSFFRSCLPDRDPKVDLVSDLVNGIQHDRSILKVEDAAKLFGMHVRTIQRLFERYVGVSPKWVIKRYRLHEAVERIDRGDVEDWTDLCINLGYYDQSHFIRDFKMIVGLPPEEYMNLVKRT